MGIKSNWLHFMHAYKDTKRLAIIAGTITLAQGDSYVDAGTGIVDDGNVSVTITGIVDTGTSGIDTITYKATVSANNTSTHQDCCG